MDPRRTLPLALFLVLCLAPGLPAQEPEAAGGGLLPSPLGGGLSFAGVTDYVWRGLNNSEYAGEGAEKMNWQLQLDLELDLEEVTGRRLGTFGGFIWWQWYAGLDDMPGAEKGTDKHLQEVDYDLHWSVEGDVIHPWLGRQGATFTLGWIAYTLPHTRGAAHATSEFYASVSLDDKGWYGLDRPLLSPSITYWRDVDDIDGSWLDVGVSHELKLEDHGLGGIPLLGKGTLTPSFTASWDLHYHDRDSSHLATLVYGVEFAAPLDGLWGGVEGVETGLTLFLHYSDAMDTDTGTEDTLYGGLGLNLAF
jgi:hypothetical protein